MKNTAIATINSVVIQILQDNEEIYVPIKPICELLGVAFQSQNQKIKEDAILSSVATLSVTTGADGKQYEMTCLPLKYVFGWLFTINPANVSEEARPNVLAYRRECYDALFTHFTVKISKFDAREKSLERTIKLQNEQATLRGKPDKTVEDFERYLVIEFELNKETTVRKSLTRDSISSMQTLF